MAIIVIIEHAAETGSALMERIRRALVSISDETGSAGVAPGVEASTGPTGAVRRIAAQLTAPIVPDAAIFRLDGEFWTLAFDGRTIRLNDSKGLRYIGHLLRYPGRLLPALEVVIAVCHGGIVPAAGGWRAMNEAAIPVLDAHAVSDYRRRLHQLREHIDHADSNGDLGQLEPLRAEAAWLEEELRDAFGLNGRARRLPSARERARQTVTKCIRSALQRIEPAHPSLARHLDRYIKTGHVCRYDPDPERTVTWEL